MMRRRDREVTDLAEMTAIMDRCDAVSVAFAGETPYVIPMSFGYACEDGHVCLYLHCAGVGEKITRMQADPHAAFAMYTGTELIEGPSACSYSTTYESVCGSGVLRRLEKEDKRAGLEAIMAHYAPEKEFSFEDRMLAAVTVLCLDVQAISGKRRAG